VLGVDVERLGIEVFSQLDAHPVRVFRTDVVADVGLDVALEESTLALNLLIEPEDLRFDEVWSDLLEPGYSKTLGDVAGIVLGTFIPDDLLPSVTIPPLYGIGIGTLIWDPTEDDNWQGAYAVLDTSAVEPIELTGCSLSAAGCGSSSSEELDFESALGCGEEGGAGCEATGCWTAGSAAPVGRALMGLVAGLGALLRRRK
jgi:hypothetical protein